MSKKNKPKIPTIKPKVTALNQVVSVASLINKAVDKSSGVPLYANHAQFLITDKEICIDLYFMGLTHQAKAEAVFLQRVVIPLVLGKGFATGLANAIASYESGESVIIENKRPPSSDDKVTIWP